MLQPIMPWVDLGILEHEMLVNVYMLVYFKKGNGMPVKIYMLIYFKRRNEMLVIIYFLYILKETGMLITCRPAAHFVSSSAVFKCSHTTLVIKV